MLRLPVSEAAAGRVTELTGRLENAEQALKEAKAAAQKAQAGLKAANRRADRAEAALKQRPRYSEDSGTLAASTAIGKVGETFKDCPDCPEMVVVPKGSFTMGSSSREDGHQDDESPLHEVRIVKPFAVGKFEITVSEYFACVKTRACKPPEWDEPGSRYNVKTGTDDHYKKLGSALKGANYPVVGVSWNGAQDYAKWLSQKTSKKYRLLSEAEWEYAARAGTQTRYFWGNSVGRNHANCYNCGSQWDGKQTAPVGSFSPNAFGLYDTAGNIWEWVEDCYKSNYNGAPSDGSPWRATSCTLRVLRGGSWLLSARDARAADRLAYVPGDRYRHIGFRVCASPGLSSSR